MSGLMGDVGSKSYLIGLQKNVSGAWITFHGTTNAINGSHNISSLTDEATGRYLLTFATALPSKEFAASGMTEAAGSGGNKGDAFVTFDSDPNSTRSTTTIRVWTETWDGNAADNERCDVNIMGG